MSSIKFLPADTVLSLLNSGDEVLAMDDLYGGSRRLFENVRKRTSNLKFNSSHHTKTSLIYDLNNDKKEETISCNYWDRWGRFNKCSIKLEDDYKIEMNLTAKRIGVLKNKKNGWHLLVIDINEKYFYNPKTNKYEKF